MNDWTVPDHFAWIAEFDSRRWSRRGQAVRRLYGPAIVVSAGSVAFLLVRWFLRRSAASRKVLAGRSAAILRVRRVRKEGATQRRRGRTAGADPRVRELMLPVSETVEYDAFVTIVEARMRALDAQALPVVADGQLTGIITRDDLWPALLDGERLFEHNRVVDYMAAVPATIGPEAGVADARRLMSKHGIHHLVVVAGARRRQPIGILSLDGNGPSSSSRDAAFSAYPERVEG